MSESNVVEFTGTTTLSTSPEKVLTKAVEAGLSDVLVLGYIDKGNDECEPYYAGSSSDLAMLLLLVERFKRDVILA
jgi:hypothetical protein